MLLIRCKSTIIQRQNKINQVLSYTRYRFVLFLLSDENGRGVLSARPEMRCRHAEAKETLLRPAPLLTILYIPDRLGTGVPAAGNGSTSRWEQEYRALGMPFPIRSGHGPVRVTVSDSAIPRPAGYCGRRAIKPLQTFPEGMAERHNRLKDSCSIRMERSVLRRFQ